MSSWTFPCSRSRSICFQYRTQVPLDNSKPTSLGAVAAPSWSCLCVTISFFLIFGVQNDLSMFLCAGSSLWSCSLSNNLCAWRVELPPVNIGHSQNESARTGFVATEISTECCVLRGQQLRMSSNSFAVSIGQNLRYCGRDSYLIIVVSPSYRVTGRLRKWFSIETITYAPFFSRSVVFL